MKITDRINEIDGVNNSQYNFDYCKLIVWINKDCPNTEGVKLKVVKMVADLQMQNSIKFFDFRMTD